jgi:hypothetical protein
VDRTPEEDVGGSNFVGLSVRREDGNPRVSGLFDK